MKKLSMNAYAKVNLKLNVVGKRENGYHNLQMINAKINLFDTIEIEKTSDPEIKVIIEPSTESLKNELCERIAHAMQEKYNFSEGVIIKITKRIPIGAGLGGGSADGAAVIHLLDELFELKLTLEKKEQIGLSFGADIPYCLTNEKAIVEGIGEKVYPVNFLLPYQILLVYPNLRITTNTVFSHVIDYSGSESIDAIRSKITNGKILALMQNDLEKIVVRLYPQVASIITMLSTTLAEKVLMSGSGSCVFALIKPEFASDVFEEVKKQFPNYQVLLHKFI